MKIKTCTVCEREFIPSKRWRRKCDECRDSGHHSATHTAKLSEHLRAYWTARKAEKEAQGGDKIK